MGSTQKRSKPEIKRSSSGPTINWLGQVSPYFTSEIIKSRKLRPRAAKPEFFPGEGKSCETHKNDLHNKHATITKINNVTARSQRSPVKKISQRRRDLHETV